jgi:molecular chaperone GrpE
MDAAREALLERFRAYLETADEDDRADATDEPRAPDLFSLLAELAALKNEVKLESRQVKGALEQFRDLFDGLRQANQQLSAELARRQQDTREIALSAERDILLELIELRDRLRDGRDRSAAYRPNWLAHASGAAAFITGMTQGMGMNLRRLDETLERRDVRPIEVVGQPFDPRIMRAIEVGRDPSMASERVIAEVRTGYRRGETLLRLADVIVNKLEDHSQ